MLAIHLSRLQGSFQTALVGMRGEGRTGEEKQAPKREEQSCTLERRQFAFRGEWNISHRLLRPSGRGR